MRVSWISGWGVAPDSLHPLAQEVEPGATHAFYPPSAGAIEAALTADWVIAWSLGAWQMLAAAARGAVCPGRVWLLAPFAAFCSDFNLGGRCSRTQVRWLRRWLQREPAAALSDFYARAGLGMTPSQLPYALEELLTGLDRLAEDSTLR